MLYRNTGIHFNLHKVNKIICLSGTLPVVKPLKPYSLANGLRCIGTQMTRMLWAYTVELQATRIITDFLPHGSRSEEHTSELQSRPHLVCRLLLEKKKKKKKNT